MTRQVQWRGVTLDQRTAAMMDELDRRTPEIPLRPTQGSYSDGSLSAGTHSGGGAIDLSVKNPRRLTLDEILEVIKIANEIGFEASWLRAAPEWTQGDHIHMIATGAPDLGSVAKNQILAVRDGYNGLGRRGRSGLDRHRDLRIKRRTWERYKLIQKRKALAAAIRRK